MTEQPDMMPPPSDDDSLIGRDLGDVPETKWAPMLADMLRVLEALYLREGQGKEEAFHLATQSAAALAEYFGGRVVYLPRGDRVRNALRDAEIYRKFRGSRNVEQLAAEYGLTVIHLYKIHRDQRALHMRKLQGRLFQD